MIIHDLTLPLNEEIPVYPGDPPFKINTISSLENSDEYNLSSISLCLHCGTHIDAPFHFRRNGKKVEDFSLEYLIGEAYIVNILNSSVINAEIMKRAVVNIETERLIIRTGFMHQSLNKSWDEGYPSLTEDASEWLINNKKLKILGIDSPDIDLFHNREFPVHKIFADNDILVIENLDLSKEEEGKGRIIISPLYVEGVEALPARVYFLKDIG
ncbi:MAG: cyclase family protein [Candidatus Coatesbacteria bacterium]|nr:cyclase family protein [Candidatus Coatesbacteria bacterium]